MEEKVTKDADEQVKKFTDEFRAHGMSCGLEIAEVAKQLHPNALLIVPLYRSCIVVEQSEQDENEGSCKIHGYADPHWRGGEIDIDTLKSEDFHFYYDVRGDRQGPEIVKMKILQSIGNENVEK